MAVKISSRTAWLWSLTLAFTLGETQLAPAGEAVASDSETTSIIFISDDSSNESPALPKSAAGAVVMIEAASKQAEVKIVTAAAEAEIKLRPKFVQPQKSQSQQNQVQQATAHGELTVVSNRQTKPALSALRPLTKPAKEATLELVSPGNMPSVAAQPAVVKIADTAQLLISAHRLAQVASKASEYTQLLQNCANAKRLGLSAEQARFADQLASWALNRRGQMRGDEGEQDLANADFETALELNPNNWRALHNRGVSFAQANQLAEAFDDFNATIQLNPNFAKAYANRATLYVQAKDLQAAIKDYEQATRCDSTLATSYVGLGRVCHMLGRLDDAVKHFSTAVELEPTNPNIICSRGDLQADLGHYSEALVDYAQTIELDAEFAHAYRNGAWLLATCPDERYRDPQNAVVGARQALEYSYGEQYVALDTLAAALANAGQYEEAVATVLQAVELAPETTRQTYLARLELYRDSKPFRTEPVGGVAQVVYEATDQ